MTEDVQTRAEQLREPAMRWLVSMEPTEHLNESLDVQAYIRALLALVALRTQERDEARKMVEERMIDHATAPVLRKRLESYEAGIARLEQEMRREYGRSDPDKILIGGDRAKRWADTLASLRAGASQP
jgi:hypothetical protein